VLNWRPQWVTDGKGGRTDFSYTPQGLLERQLDPAVNGLRKRTLIEYETAGTSAAPVYRKAKVRSCEVAAANLFTPPGASGRDGPRAPARRGRRSRRRGGRR
jgi:hypothetical protein